LFGDERIGQRAAAFEILEVRPRDIVALGAAVGAGDRDQVFLASDKWKWTKEDALDPAEHRGRGADPGDQTDQRENREAGIPPQHPKSEPQIVKHGSAQVVLNALPNARSEKATIVIVEAQSVSRMALAARARTGPNVMPRDWCQRYSAAVNAASVSAARNGHA